MIECLTRIHVFFSQLPRERSSYCMLGWDAALQIRLWTEACQSSSCRGGWHWGSTRRISPWSDSVTAFIHSCALTLSMPLVGRVCTCTPTILAVTPLEEARMLILGFFLRHYLEDLHSITHNTRRSRSAQHCPFHLGNHSCLCDYRCQCPSSRLFSPLLLCPHIVCSFSTRPSRKSGASRKSSTSTSRGKGFQTRPSSARSRA